MFHAFVFILLAAGCLYLAVVYQGLLWLLLWLGGCFLWVAIAYATSRPRLYGKRVDGKIAPPALIGLLPIFALTWGVWRLACRLSRERRVDELTPGLLIGRRLLPRELPAGVKSIVDLTAEFPGSFASPEQRYLNHPILDGSSISPAELARLAEQIDALPQPVFIHCAQGHGRTGMVAAAWLLHRGLAASADEAIRMAQACRPGIKLSDRQQRTVAAAAGLINGSKSPSSS